MQVINSRTVGERKTKRLDSASHLVDLDIADESTETRRAGFKRNDPYAVGERAIYRINADIRADVPQNLAGLYPVINPCHRFGFAIMESEWIVECARG